VGDEEATTSVVSGEKLLRTIILDNKLELYGLYVSFWSSYLAYGRVDHGQKRLCLNGAELRGVSKRICWSLAIA
jgi:hypothetical protein